MSEDILFLLTDEFSSFSSRIRSIHEKKKELKEEFQAFKERIKQEFKDLDDEAKLLNEEFTKWKISFEKNSKEENQ